MQIDEERLWNYLEESFRLEFSSMWSSRVVESVEVRDVESVMAAVDEVMTQHGVINPPMLFSPSDYAVMRDQSALMVSCVIRHNSCIWLIWEHAGRSVPKLHILGPTTKTHKVRNAAQLHNYIGEDVLTERTWITVDSKMFFEPMRVDLNTTMSKEKKTLFRLWQLLAMERSALMTLGVYALFVGLLSLLMPLATQIIVSTLAFTTLLQPLLLLTIVVLMGLSIAGILKVFEHAIVEFIQRRIFHRTVQDTTIRLLRLDRTNIQNRHIPELVNRFFDVITLQKASSTLLLDGISLTLQTVIGLIVLAFYHPFMMAFAAFLLTSVSFILVVLGRGAIKTSLKESNAKYEMASWLEDIAQSPHGLKSDVNMKRAMQQSQRLTVNYLQHRKSHYTIFIRQIMGAVILQVIANATLIGLGGWLVLNAQLTLGQLVAAEIIVTMIVAGIVKFGKQFETFYDLCASLYKLGELIDLPLEKHGVRTGYTTSAHEFELKDFTVDPGTQPTINMVIEQGQMVALINTPGRHAAKTLKAMFGLNVQNSQGCVLFDGIRVKQWSLPKLRRHVALIEEVDLFNTSLEDNIFWIAPKVDEAMRQNIMKTLDIDEFALRLPDGWNTPLLPHADLLHPSQQLSVVLARHLLQNPDVLLIDSLLDILDIEMVKRWLRLFNEMELSIVVATRRQDIAGLCQHCINFRTTKVQFNEGSP